jgi:hypothetical protein
MEKLNKLAIFLCDKGFRHEAKYLIRVAGIVTDGMEYVAENLGLIEPEGPKISFMIEDMCNKEIAVSIKETGSKVEEIHNGMVVTHYEAKVENSIFDDINIRFSDASLRKLNEKEYGNYNYYFSRRKIDDFVKKPISEETKSIIFRRITVLFTDFLIMFQSFLCSDRNKKIISQNDDYRKKFDRFFKTYTTIDIILEGRRDDSHNRGAPFDSKIDITLKQRTPHSYEKTEEYLKSFESTLYHEMMHSFIFSFKMNDFDRVFSNPSFKAYGFDISFPSDPNIQKRFYEDFFKKFYGIDVSNLNFGEYMWDQVVMYLTDQTNYDAITEYGPKCEFRDKLYAAVMKDVFGSDFDIKQQEDKEKAETLKKAIITLKGDSLMTEEAMDLISVRNIEHVSNDGHLTMMVREFYRFADRTAKNLDENTYEEIFRKLLTLKYPKEIYLNNLDLLRATMLFYGDPNGNSKKLLMFIKSVKMDEKKDSVPV